MLYWINDVFCQQALYWRKLCTQIDWGELREVGKGNYVLGRRKENGGNG